MDDEVKVYGKNNIWFPFEIIVRVESLLMWYIHGIEMYKIYKSQKRHPWIVLCFLFTNTPYNHPPQHTRIEDFQLRRFSTITTTQKMVSKSWINDWNASMRKIHLKYILIVNNFILERAKLRFIKTSVVGNFTCIFFKNFLKLKYSWFTVFYWFLLCSKVSQFFMYTCICSFLDSFPI